jgi:hypothetical protein
MAVKLKSLVIAIMLLGFSFSAFSADNFTWDWGLRGGLGYFNFRNSLFLDIEPDPPADHGEDWAEFYIKPWVSFENTLDSGAVFGKASYAYARTDDDAVQISGGGADSYDFDELYLGWKTRFSDSDELTLVGGRYPYQIAHGFLLSDGYADGGSRGGLWSNPRTAWAPGAKFLFLTGGHLFEGFYLERDERPESDSETEITGLNYQWRSRDKKWTLGGSWFAMNANSLAPQRDGADVWNLRLYAQPFNAPLMIEAEWAYEDNGLALDSNAFYVQPYWTLTKTRWQWTFYYRYAVYQGDDPDTIANEAFDPLFPAFHDWGSWWQGEIAGEYLLSNSNLKTHMLRLHATPSKTISTGLLFFDYALDERGSYNGGVSSDDLGQELDWYFDWTVSSFAAFSFVVARTQPGKAVKEAFGRHKDFKFAMVYLTLNY